LFAFGCQTRTSRRSAAYGSFLSSAPFTMLNTAVEAPMPRATVMTERAVKAGVFERDRVARRMSRRMSLMDVAGQ
jgi:hypothetical protein